MKLLHLLGLHLFIRKDGFMSKKIIIVVISVVVLVLATIIIFKVKENKKADLTIKSEEPIDGESIEISGDNGTCYEIVYDADSFVYQIIDENGILLFVTPNKGTVDDFIKDPIIEKFKPQEQTEEIIEIVEE